MESAPIDPCLERIRQAVQRLISEFSDMMLACYTDYFDPDTPTDLFHLGRMLQFAVLLEGVANPLATPRT